ncbi:hypothetical protein DAI22_02g065100 [Oryza sativa Japonica Group]|nr:hypothetical protein DAI22_02g065100 [Oryza sativa Japonica Group]
MAYHYSKFRRLTTLAPPVAPAAGNPSRRLVTVRRSSFSEVDARRSRWGDRGEASGESVRELVARPPGVRRNVAPGCSANCTDRRSRGCRMRGLLRRCVPARKAISLSAGRALIKYHVFVSAAYHHTMDHLYAIMGCPIGPSPLG